MDSEESVIATVRMFGGNFAPRGWALCEGQLLAISSNSALFSLIGTIYGGDGRTTFALPDLRGRIALGNGDGPGLSGVNMGQRGGGEQSFLNQTNLPPHTHGHTAKVSNTNASVSTPVAGNSIATPGTASARAFAATDGFVAGAPNVATNGSTVTIGDTGGSIPVNNEQPFLGLNYIICLVGIYPSRN